MEEHAQKAHEDVEGTEHAGHGSSASHRKRCVLVVSFLAVFSALIGLMSEHAANDAILVQNQASDQWDYAGQKDTRGYVAHATADLGALIATIPGVDQNRAQELIKTYTHDVERYAEQKKEIQDKARELEQEKADRLSFHVRLGYATASLTLGIVAATVALMLVGEAFFFAALGCGALGLAAVLNAFLLHLL